MPVEIVRTEEGIRQMAGPWREVYRATPWASPFSSWEWAYTWWKHLGRRGHPFVLTFRRGGEVRGLLPLWRYPGLGAGRLGFMGQGVSDYLDLLAYPEDTGIVLESFGESLRRYRGWLAVDLQHVPAVSPLARYLAPGFPDDRLLSRGHRQDVCFDLPLPGSWEEFRRNLKKSFQQNLAYAERRLSREHAVEFRLTPPTELSRALVRLFELHQRRWRARGFPGAFYRPQVRAFHREAAWRLAEAGELGLFELAVDGEVVASLYGFRGPRAFYYYLGGFDPLWAGRSVGNVLLRRVLAWAIEEGLERFDFLRGEEPYKLLWSAERKTNLRLILSRRRVFAPLILRSAEVQTMVTEGLKRRFSRHGRQ